MNIEYLHGTSFEAAKAELDHNGLAYSNAVIDGKEYYYALKTMEHTDWTLLFLVPSEYVAQNVVTLVNATTTVILVFSLLMLVVSAVIITVILLTSQKRTLAIERENNVKLTAAVERAEKATKAKTEFLANMSHDIRTPMNAIVGITGLMERDPGDPQKMRDNIHKVQSSSRHMLGLINDILDMSRIESGEIHLTSESVSLAEQIGQLESIIRPQAVEKGQDFCINVDGVAHEYLIGDSVRLRQIFLNLLSNAVKYTPCGGKIPHEYPVYEVRKQSVPAGVFSQNNTFPVSCCSVRPEPPL